METQEIIEGNRLIAEFDQKVKPGWIFRDDEMAYDSSWTWLMPIVEQIENKHDASFYFFQNECRFYTLTAHTVVVNGESLRLSRLETIWQAVVAFIKWHNEHTNTTP